MLEMEGSWLTYKPNRNIYLCLTLYTRAVLHLQYKKHTLYVLLSNLTRDDNNHHVSLDISHTYIMLYIYHYNSKVCVCVSVWRERELWCRLVWEV